MRTRYHRFLCPAAVLLLALLTIGSAANAQPSGDALWTEVNESTLQGISERSIVPASYRTLALDKGLLREILFTAPFETRAGVKGGEAVLSLPLPEGGFGRFRIVESPIMAPGLAAKFPEIKTYRGQGIDDPTATVRFDLTPAGFHAMILSPGGSVYIDPYSREDTDHYISYLGSKAVRRGEAFTCGVRSHGPHPIPRATLAVAKAVSGSTLRTYRLAVAATGEYTAFHGGTVAQGQAAIVTAINRVTGIYEREVAVRMVLVANNDQIVYTNSGSDPYTNNNGSTMLGQNQSTIDSVIGSANYDIGHVFSTGGGGVASLRVPCVNGSKARGVTGQSSPTGDSFWVDYVAHEMGHQWGGNHTFNGNEGSCAGGNRNGSTAYEPGSGTTIMAYAGICGSQNIQNNSDDYFHGISLDEIISFSTGSGNSCAVQTATGNSPPTVNAGDAYTIPLDTPFELCGSATDPESDPLTYGWEEFDLGPAGAPNSPSGDAAIFRTFDAATSPCRTFPQLSDLVNNTQTIGEILPSYARTMSFRLTARDNRSGGGGVNDDSTTVTASSVGGPFLVTAPNTAVTWSVGTSQNVTWNVAGTDLSPISCSSVDITLSTDGGTTYSITLASGVSNSGSQSVTVPAAATTSARVKVQCAGNIFFDISNADFTIDGTSGAPPTVAISAPADGSSSELGDSVIFTGSASDPEDGDISASLIWSSSLDGNIGSGASFATTALSLGSHTITASVTDSDGLSGSDVISISVTPVGGGNGPQDAAYDSGLGAPACAVAGSSCDSLALLDGVANAGPEPNQPNTLDGCTDGTSGSYHSDESNDRIFVTTLDGADMVEGATVRVDATVWAWTTPSADTLDLYYAADANSPTWVHIDSIVATVAGEQTLSATYTLPAGTLQAVRANFRYQGSQSPCSGGAYDDADDLVFAAGPDACTSDAQCDNGLYCDGAETCNVGTGVCEAGTAVSCGDGVSCTVDSCNEGTDSCDNTATNSLCDNGLFCDGTETCDAVLDCQAGTAVSCGDGVSCTIDSCNEGTDSCDNTPDDTVCDNGLFCDGAEVCDAILDCQDSADPCTGPGQTCDEAGDVCEGGTGCLSEVDFESGAGGWTGGADTCTTGAFVVGSPDATTWQVGGGNPGNAFYTQPNTGGLGTDDVDGGTCEALSAVIDASGQAAVEVSLDYFHGQRDAGDDANDGFTIEVLNNGSVVDTLVSIGDVTTNPVWTTVSTTVTNPGNIQVRVRATDAAGAGDIVEGGIDNVQICPTTAPPPCTIDDDFEGGAAGWTTSGTCTTGTFVLATPTEQTSTVVTQVGGDHTTGSGNALFTATNISAGNADVDGGECVLTSPVYDITDASDLEVWYFHGQRDTGDDASGDYFELEASVNGGAYSPFVSIGDVQTVASWTNATTTVPAGSTVQLRVRVSDGASTGDIVEGAIDDLSICPQ